MEKKTLLGLVRNKVNELTNLCLLTNLSNDDEPLLFHTGHRPFFPLGLRSHRESAASQEAPLRRFFAL